MKLKFFSIPVSNSEPFAEELNQFIAQHRVARVEREFCRKEACWSICVEYLEGATGEKKSKSRQIDYREMLDAETFQIFSALREWRKVRAAKEGIPIYSVADNKQLAAIAESRCTSMEALQKIEGFGETRIRKYGESLLTVLNDAETKGSD